MPTSVVLGGGISGLASACYLCRSLPSSHRIMLLEKSKRFGGWIRSARRRDGTLYEAGPRSIRPVGIPGLLTLDLLTSIASEAELGIVTVAKTHPAAQNRYIYYDDRLNKAPNSLLSALSASLKSSSPFHGVVTAAAREPFHKRPRHSYAGHQDADESVDSFVTRHFGANIAGNVLSALVHGIYAGDTRNLSIQAIFPSLWRLEQRYGSVVLGMLRGGSKPSADEVALKRRLEERLGSLAESMKKVSIYSFRDGLEAIPRVLTGYLAKQDNVELRPGTEVLKLAHKGGKITVDTGSERIEADNVVSALSGAHLHPLVDLPNLSHNPSVTVGVVNVALPESFKLPVTGFGYLIPRTVSFKQNPHNALGVIFDSETFEGQQTGSTPKLTRLTVMMGGAYWSARSTFPSNDELCRAAVDTLRLHGILPNSVEPVFTQAHLQRDCIPQYTVGHVNRMRQLHTALLENYDGRLAVVGSSYTGVGLNDCVKSSFDACSRLVASGRATGLEGFMVSA